MTYRYGAPSALIIAFAACAPLAASPSAGGLPPTKAAPVVIEMFGTKQVTMEHLVSSYGKQLRELCNARPPDPTRLLAHLEALGDFADVELGLVGPYDPNDMKCYVTVDFVDRADAGRRMPFWPEPTGTYQDPDGLLADWHTYEAKERDLVASNQLSSQRVECPAFHCLGDHSHPALSRLADRFIKRVPANVKGLAAILRDDRWPSHRAAAAYLLAYSTDGPALVNRMLAASCDSVGLVRNNALRVLSDIALYHPELEIPIAPVLAALEYPTTLDRNKAAAIILGLIERPTGDRLHLLIAQRAGPTLLAMLRLQVPNNHNFAYLILKAISGQGYGERDYAAWEGWLAHVIKS